MIGNLQFKAKHSPQEFPVALEQTGHYYWMNMRGLPPNDLWYGTRVCQRAMLDKVSPQEIRAMDCSGRSVWNGGWHYSFLGGADKIRQKVESYSHHDLATAENMSAANLDRCLRTGDDLFGRDYVKFAIDPDPEYPKHVLENRERFAHLIAG